MKFWQNTSKVLLIIDSHRFPQSQMNAIGVGRSQISRVQLLIWIWQKINLKIVLCHNIFI